MKKSQKSTTPIESFSRWIGSPSSLMVHTAAFTGAFSIAVFGFAPWDTVLLVVTTIVSLEAIYLAIFIQMGVNRAESSLAGVEEDVAEIEESIDDISEDIEGIEKDVAEIEESIDDISEDIEGIEKDVAELEENIDEVSEGLEDLSEGETRDNERKLRQEVTLTDITQTLSQLTREIEALKKNL